MTRTISKFDDVIDSRDVIKRIAELEDERDAFEPEVAEADEPVDATDELAIAKAEAEPVTWADVNDDEAEELKVLTALADEASGASDWVHGETLINDDYFEQYAEQLAEDIGAISRDATWPNNHIDWKAAAEALQQDYTSVDFDGQTFWIRS